MSGTDPRKTKTDVEAHVDRLFEFVNKMLITTAWIIGVIIAFQSSWRNFGFDLVGVISGTLTVLAVIPACAISITLLIGLKLKIDSFIESLPYDESLKRGPLALKMIFVIFCLCVIPYLSLLIAGSLPTPPP